MLKIYTDGSFNATTETYGWAYAIYNESDSIIKEDSGSGNGPASTMRNIAGELSAVMHAVQVISKASNNKRTIEATIYHDYTGISKWVDGSWKTKNSFTVAYKKFISDSVENSNIILHFECIKGHSGIAGNEHVDTLAKEARGV